MKAHEETWLTSYSSACRHEIHPADDKYQTIAEFRDFDFNDDAEREWLTAQGDRAQLAAAAPEMARLLLDLAAYRNCEFCEQKIDRHFDPPESDNMRPHWHCHSSTCPLRVILTKAGIAS